MRQGLVFSLIFVLTSPLLTGCKKHDVHETRSRIANPASVYCINQGGKLDVRKGPGGGEVGVCVFEDGSECEEWSFFRGECKKGEKGTVPDRR